MQVAILFLLLSAISAIFGAVTTQADELRLGCLGAPDSWDRRLPAGSFFGAAKKEPARCRRSQGSGVWTRLLARKATKSERGKFFRTGATLSPPVHLEPEVLRFLETKAKAHGATVSALVNQLLKKESELIEAAE